MESKKRKGGRKKRGKERKKEIYKFDKEGIMKSMKVIWERTRGKRERVKE